MKAVSLSFLMRIGFLCAFATLPSSLSAQTTALLLYGGSDHKEFAGCINCASTSSQSICNDYGEFGSEYRLDSIWNAYGHFGSRYNSDSPWNKYAAPSMVIVDQSGSFYGYFTANTFAANRTRISALQQLADLGAESSDLTSVRKAFCD